MTTITALDDATGRASVANPDIGAGARLRQIDILRGLVIVLMALDHVRDYFHAGAFVFNPLDPERTNAALYATRWITHLCAPSFIFLAGVSIYLRQIKVQDTSKLSSFLLSRGIWLVALELTVISFAWSFAVPYRLFLQVIWAIGWSMIAMAGLVWLPRPAVLALGVAIIAGHNLLDPIRPDQLGDFALLWTFLHEGGRLLVSHVPVGFASYPVLPWLGVMALGYGMGVIFVASSDRRDRTLLLLGAMMIGLFLLLRVFNLYGDPDHWNVLTNFTRTAMSFLDVHKYPPSLMYVLVTLGIALVLTPALARLSGPVATFLLTFGSVPFFFYVLHLYLVHALAIAANAALGHEVTELFNFLMNMIRNPEAHVERGFSLPGVYLAWIIVLALLYPICRWWAGLKRMRHRWWLSYL